MSFYLFQSFAPRSLLSRYIDHFYLHSFPTRRSSDLPHSIPERPDCRLNSSKAKASIGSDRLPYGARSRNRGVASPRYARSEEHTSELQSQFHLVCRLLLEKNNNIETNSNITSSFKRL